MLGTIQKNPAAANLSVIDGGLIQGGGAPGGQLDEQCAQDGVERIADRLK